MLTSQFDQPQEADLYSALLRRETAVSRVSETGGRPRSEIPRVLRTDQCAPQLRLLSAEQRRDAEVIWRALEEVLGSVPLSCSWDWTRLWLETYGRVLPHRFAVWERSGRIRGICLLVNGTEAVGPVRLSVLHVGTAGERDEESVCVEYNGVLASSAEAPAMVAAIANFCRRERDYDELHFDGFPSETLVALRRGGKKCVVQSEACHYFDLQAARQNGQQVEDVLSRGTMKKVRRNLRDFGECAIEWADSAAEALDIYEEMVELHQVRWQAAGALGAYYGRRFYQFHRRAIEKFVADGRTVLFRVRAGGKTIGCLHHYVDRGRVLCYQSGLCEMHGARRSPGLLVDFLCLQECLRRGYDAYDFLGGAMFHKSRLSNASRELQWVRVPLRPWKHHTLEGLRRLKRLLGRLEKEV